MTSRIRPAAANSKQIRAVLRTRSRNATEPAVPGMRVSERDVQTHQPVVKAPSFIPCKPYGPSLTAHTDTKDSSVG